jgi:lipopolysaccharide transport system ATP-binding protein
MSKPVIKVENLSKAYQLGQIGTGTISRDIDRFVKTKILGKEDPFLKIGETNDRSSKGNSDIVWSLKDINFEVNQGDAVGIIGKNGAGKSTLLKLLSRVTSPTTGNIKVKGRIASLLEVGTGFHPELSGRENIYLNGAILGMRKKEITRKLDEIIDFSGVERYIDTPVKRYSSGMYVRLAFAVAAHLESEILIVDEVLAVGDAEFQKKCLGKMGDISKTDGRTILFVSHNMAAVQNLCSKSFVLEKGNISFIGNSNNAIDYYLNSNQQEDTNNALNNFIDNQNDDTFYLKSFTIYQNSKNTDTVVTNEDICINYKFEVYKNVLGLRIGFDLIDLVTGLVIFRTFHDDNEKQINQFHSGNYNFNVTIPKDFLAVGKYAIKPIVGIHKRKWILYNDNIYKTIETINFDGINSIYAETRPGLLMPKMNWNLQ